MSEQNAKKPVVVTLTGPSAGGKSTIQQAMLDSGLFESLISFTDREPRHGETHGKEYYFYSKPEIEQLRDQGKIAELVEFQGKAYGLTTDEFERAWIAKKIPVVVVEPESGLPQLREIAKTKGWTVLSAFVAAPPEELVSRQLERLVIEVKNAGKVNLQYAAKRMVNTLMHEFAEWRKYDYDLLFENNVGQSSIHHATFILRGSAEMLEAGASLSHTKMWANSWAEDVNKSSQSLQQPLQASQVDKKKLKP